MQIPQRYKFIIQLGKALHTYGVPSYKIESYLADVAIKKGIKGSFMDSPTWINYVFYEEDEQTYNYVECVPPGEINLGNLSRITQVTDRVISDDLDFSEAKQAIQNIEEGSSGYGKLAELLAYILSAGSFSLILGTNWTSALLAALLGALSYGFTRLTLKSGYIKSTLESMVALTLTLIAGIASYFIDGINVSMSILSGIIIFVPGLALTTALEEITARNLVAGTAKLFDALVSLFKQFFGVLLGLTLLPFFIEVRTVEVVHSAPQTIYGLAAIALVASLMIVFKVRRKDLLLAGLTGFCSFIITMLLEPTGILISIFIGTIVTVLMSKYLKKLTRTPKLVFLTLGIVMLVPGSKAFISLSTVFQESTTATSINLAEQVFYIFMAIIGGLIFSGSFAVYSSKPQNSANGNSTEIKH